MEKFTEIWEFMPKLYSATGPIYLHKNSQKRFYNSDFIYFITSVVSERMNFFKEDVFCELFVDNLRTCKELKKFKLYGFVILHDHVHLLIKPDEEYNISEVMQSIKRHFSRNVNIIIDDDHLIFNEGEVCKPRLHLDEHKFNEKLIYYHNIFVKKYNHIQNQIPPFKWQQSFRDHVIRNEKDFLNHLNYIYFNPIKHKICEDETKYKWSFINPEFADLYLHVPHL